MIRIAVVVLAAAMLQEKPEVDGAAVAKELLERVEKKLAAAKTVRIAFRIHRRESQVEGELLWRLPNQIRLRLALKGGAESLTRCDGRRVAYEGDGEFEPLPQDLKAMAEVARRICLYGYPAWEPSLGKPQDFFLGGKETINGVAYQLITYELPGPRRNGARVRVWIDPAGPSIFRRAFEFSEDLRGQFRTETILKVQFDEDLAADEFAFQDYPKLVRAAVEGQVARSVELYARFMGRLPRTLDDLDAPPKDGDAFWPEGGFWIGGKRPADLKYSMTGGEAVVGAQRIEAPTGGRIAPTSDRLKKYYSARLRLQLISAAVEAWCVAYRHYPRRLEHLADKPDGVETWPEGGFLAESALTDPWGEAYIGRGDGFVMAAKRHEKTVPASKITPEELSELESRAFPPLTPEERKRLESAWSRLEDDDIQARDRAFQSLLEFGPAGLPEFEARWAAASDDLKDRLRPVRDRLAKGKRSWQRELRPLTAHYIPPGRLEKIIAVNEQAISAALRSIWRAQADFRAVDYDGNGRQDYWVRDIAGLYGMKKGGDPGGPEDEVAVIKLIHPSIAAADATPGRESYGILGASTEPEPYRGFLFTVLKSESPEARGYKIVAYPYEYGMTGRLTFLVSDDGRIWKQDQGGVVATDVPANPRSAGWAPVE